MDALASTFTVERRLKARYPIRLPARYRGLDRGSQIEGAGHTVNISSGGLLFSCQDDIKSGTRLEVLIAWPSLLESTVPLQLVATGRVIRSERGMIVIEFSQHQFRTMKSKPFPRLLALERSA